MKPRAFTIIEVLVVIGIIAVLAAIAFPAYLAYLENAKIQETQSQLGILDAALAQYQREFGDYPPSPIGDDNAGTETMLAALRTTERGGPFIKEHIIARWLRDTDNDGRQELADPWRTPWIYFHPASYTAGPARIRSSEHTFEAQPSKQGDTYRNLVTYQLWSCGPNRTDEAGVGDDIGNLVR